MKIAMLYLDLGKKGGAGRSLLSFAQELSRRGHEVTIITERYSPNIYHEVISGKIIQTSFYPIHFHKWLGKKETKKFFREFDIINPHDPWTWLSYSLSKVMPKEVTSVAMFNEPIRYFHEKAIDKNSNHYYWSSVKMTCSNMVKRYPSLSFFNPSMFYVLANILKRLDVIITSSSFTAYTGNSNFCVKLIREIYGRNAYPVLPGVDETYFHGIPKFPENKINFVYCGNLPFHKNIREMIFGAYLAYKKNSSIRFKILCGSTGDSSPYLRLIKALKAEKCVEFIISPTNDEIRHEYLTARGILYVTLAEPFGLVPVEGMACYKPAIVSNYGGPSETVVNGRTGIHVDPLDRKSIAKAILRLANDVEISIKMGKAARRRLEKLFTIKAATNRLEAVFRDVLKLRL